MVSCAFGKAVTSAVTEVLHDPSILDESATCLQSTRMNARSGRAGAVESVQLELSCVQVLITVNECSVEEWREKKRMLVNVMQGGRCVLHA